MQNSEPRTYLFCPFCNAVLLAKGAVKHCSKVHGKTVLLADLKPAPNPVFPKKRKPTIKKSSIQRRFDRCAEILRAESRMEAYAAKLKSSPHKCATPNCSRLVPPVETFCDDCKASKIGAPIHFIPHGFHRKLCGCGAVVVGEEDRCYSCLGD